MMVEPAAPRAQHLLLASIHDVSPRSEAATDQLAALLARRLGAAAFAMLVVPDHWHQAPIGRGTPFAARLRGWAEAGVEMFVHGYYHQDSSRHGGLARVKAQHMTAGEGEFLGLAQGEAAQRMADGKALIEDIIGRPAAGFIAPAWLYGPGARAALADSGFAIAEDHWRVWQPATGRPLARGPVITWASRSRGRQLSSRGFAALARRALHRQRIVRLAVHPGDTTVPALLRSIERTTASFAARRRAGRYRELLPPDDSA